LNAVSAQEKISFISSNEENLISNWGNSEFKDSPSFLQFSISSAQENRLNSFYATHKSELATKIKDRDSNKKKAETIFNYLHENVFIRYNLNSEVNDLLNSQTYNCVTATSFFISMAEEFEIPFTIYETPAHVYASISHRNDEIIVELTDPRDGFDFGSNMEALLQTLVNSKLISRDELAEKGPEELYREYVAKTIPISKKKLLAIQYYNEALIKSNSEDYDAAYNQMNKAIALYKNQTFSKTFKYIVTISQLDFKLDISKKYNLLNRLLVSTKNDSVLSYNLVNHLGELIEDLLKYEENFDLAKDLLSDVEANIFHDTFIDEKIRDYYVYMYTAFAQNASLKGESLEAKNNIEKALQLDPDNSRLTTYYVSVTSNYASKLSQLGLFETARSTIDELAANYPEGYPIIKEARVQIILDALVPVQIVIENESKLLPELELARSIQPDNIYLKSFSATVFHELAMQQVRRSNYRKAKTLILNGLDYSPKNATLRSDLDLINKILK
tara:strand:+ start:1850 stop:3358 length:1509 start_codon:yes stop_codon:yes gene_type:complete